jgi:hypothetical protein
MGLESGTYLSEQYGEPQSTGSTAPARSRSRLDELVVDPDATVVVQKEDL